MYEGSRVTLKLNVYARPFYTLPLLYLPTYILRIFTHFYVKMKRDGGGKKSAHEPKAQTVAAYPGFLSIKHA